MIDLARVCHVHFVGLGGVGMCGIAEVLFNQGHKVSGSDLVSSSVTKRLAALGIQVFHGHDAVHIGTADVVVVSAAVPAHNPEVLAALSQSIPVIPRAMALSELMRFRYGIAVSGTHGKTTTTSLISSVLAQAGHDPTFVIGGRINHLDTHARLGKSRYIVTEADESDKSFLYLKPIVAVLTNIDGDHLEAYDHSVDKLRETFVRFIEQVPFYGLAALCIDDPGVQAIVPKLSCPIRTYGFDESAQVHALNYHHKNGQSCFDVSIQGGEHWPVVLNLPGRHNVQNALATIAISDYLDIDHDQIQKALQQFSGVARRFQMYGEFDVQDGKALLLDDYGHHPREIEVTIDAMHALWPQRRKVMLFQPHRYSRTRTLWHEFVKVLSSLDSLILLDIYSAGESEEPNINSEELYRALRAVNPKLCIHYIPSEQLNFPRLHSMLQKNDVFITQGAGDVGQLAKQFSDYVHATVVA